MGPWVEAAATAALQNVLRDGYLRTRHPMQPNTSNISHRPSRPDRPAANPALKTAAPSHALPGAGQRQPQPAGPKAPPTWDDLFGQR